MSNPHVVIRDVTPRDGLQSERPIPATERARLAAALGSAGISEVEAVSFVSAATVPSMADAATVIGALPNTETTRWWALVPNQKGVELAVEVGIEAVTVTVSASEEYSRRNVKRSTTDALHQLPELIAAAQGRTTDVIVSCAFGSPYDDVTLSRVVGVIEAARAAHPTQLTLADTTGTATPGRIAEVLANVSVDVGMHLHDTRRTALANALAAYELGVRRFDTAVGGLGGSPFASDAGGNLATEDLVLVLEDHGVRTGIDLDAVGRIAEKLAPLLGRDLPQGRGKPSSLPPFPPG